MTTRQTSSESPKNIGSRDYWRVFGPAIVIAVVGFAIAYSFMKPAPPKHIVIGTGSQDGAYYAAARRYAEQLAEEGITLEVRETSGSVENLELLQREADGVEVALVQGGSFPSQSDGLVSLGTVYYEPLWIFVRADSPTAQETRLTALEGLRLAAGKPGSGTRDLAMRLLEENGLQDPPTRFLELSAREGATALLAGEADALFFVAGHDAPLVVELLQEKKVRPLSLSRAEAYTRRHHFLGRAVLPQGVTSLERNLPDRDITLIAPVANIVAREDLHPALVVLLLQAATKIHGDGGILERPGEFPSPYYANFDLHESAQHYLESGPPFLQKFLPFWAAIFVDRMIIFLIPLLTIFIPLFKILPPTYRWRVRSRIYRWYRDLMTADREATADPDPANLSARLTELERMRLEIAQIKVPLSYADELYDLHVHVELVRDRLQARLSGVTEA